MTLGEACTG